MKKILKILVTLVLTPLFLVILWFKKIFELIEPLAQTIGNNITEFFINLYNSMYEFWRQVFNWR